MGYSEDQPKGAKPGQRGLFRLDVLLLAFLLVGWSLIFTTATLGLQRSEQQWLSVGLVSEAAADYSAAPTGALRLARLDPEIIEAIKQDQLQQLATPTPSVAVLTTTPTPTATPTATPMIGSLFVSAGGPYEGEEGSSISLIAENTSVLGLIPGVISYFWDLDNDGQYDDANDASASVVFYDEGEYPISVQATDLLGRVDTDTTTIQVSNAPPLITMGQDIETGEGQEVAFAATANDPGHDLLFFEWDFDDGSPPVKDTLSPHHTYVNNELYTVRLQVKDNDGGVTEDFLTVNVGNLPPLVNAGPDQVTTEGSAVVLNGTATDPGKLDKLTYAWDLNYDGSTFIADWGNKTASTIYPDGPATIIAAFRARDNGGGEDIDTVKITVNNVPPVITSVSNDGPVGEGSSLSLTVSATDAGNDPLTFAFDWQDDGTFDTVGQPSAVSNIWYNQGEFTVRIRVDDGDGGQAFTTTTISTLNEPPIAIVNADSEQFEGSAVLFDASDSYDSGINDVLTYQWDFGDGSSASGVNASHVYADNKVYSATLTVTDDSDAVSTAAVGVSILNANPVANAGSDLIVDEGINVTLSFNGTATDPGTADILTYEWDFNYDGVSFNSEATGASPTHIFSIPDGPKDYIVALRVRDDDYPASTGETGEHIDTLKLTVKNLPPWNVSAGGPYLSTVSQPITLNGTAQDFIFDTLTYAWDLDNDGSFETPGQTALFVQSTPGLYPVKLRVRDEDGGEVIVSTQVNINALPTAVAVITPTTTLEGQLVAFDGSSSSDLDNDPLTYYWNFGDGSTATGITATHTYADNSVYTSTLTILDIDGGVATASVAVTTLNANPIANAGTDRVVSEAVSVNLVGAATDPGTADTLTYEWDFNYNSNNFDSEATGQSVSHTYADGPATYVVALRVRDDDYPYPTSGGGEIGENLDTLTVTVTNTPPLAEAGGPYPGVEGQSVTLSGSATDASADTLTYAWDLDNNGIFETPGQTVINTWLTGGLYTVALQVTDDDGGIDTDTASVDINFIPTAVAGGPYGGDEGVAITFNGNSSSDPDNDPLTYTWNFGDGSPPANGVNPTHTYADNGIYNVTLQVNDGQGGIATATTTATINNLSPTANAGPDQTTAEGATITLDGSASSDPGGGPPLNFAWDLDGDGQFDDASTATPSYSWSEPGVYTVALLVTDAGGLTSTDTAQITVTNLPPVANAGPDQTIAEGATVTLNGSGSNDPGGGSLTFAWDLDGDGQFDDANTATASNTWAEPGTFTVSLQVTDAQGLSSTDTVQVTVTNLQPSADAGPDPRPVSLNQTVTFDGGGSSDPGGGSLTFAWDLDNDGNFDDGSSQTVNYTWTITGSYTIILQVEDGDGGVGTDTVTVLVNGVLPLVWLPRAYGLLRRKRQGKRQGPKISKEEGDGDGRSF